MPWCPTCKKKIEEDVMICPECRGMTEEMISLITLEDNQAEDLAAFLEYSKITALARTRNEGAGTTTLLVPKWAFRDADKYLKAYLAQNNLEDIEPEDDMTGQQDPRETKPKSSAAVYTGKEQQYNEVKSSAYVFMAVGIIGLGCFALLYLGVLPFSLPLSTFSYFVMMLVFLIFMVIGITSMKNAVKLNVEAETEKQKNKEITDWFLANYKDELLAAEHNEESDEALYFQQYEMIKTRISKKYPDLNEAYLDSLVEDLHQTIFS